MAFTKFTDYGASSREFVTLRANQSIFISKSILKIYNAIDSNSAYIFIDEEKKLIAIEFLKKEKLTDSRYINKEKSGASINITPILKVLGVKKKNKKIHLNIFSENNLLIINLNNAFAEI